MKGYYKKFREELLNSCVPFWLAQAQRLQYDINEIIYGMCSGKCNLYAMIKQIILKREGLDLGGVRAPLANLFPEDLAIADSVAKMIDKAVAAYIA